MVKFIIMREIVFLRHGQAGIAESDSERPLTETGRRQAMESALRLKEKGFRPGIIISSPYKRALQTAEIAREIIFDGDKEKPEIAEAIAIAIQDYDTTMAALDATLEKYSSVLAVGHVPLFEEMPQDICGTYTRMRTGSFAWIETAEGILPGRRSKCSLKENFIPGNS